MELKALAENWHSKTIIPGGFSKRCQTPTSNKMRIISWLNGDYMPMPLFPAFQLRLFNFVDYIPQPHLLASGKIGNL